MFKVHILGTSSAVPAFSRNPSAQIVSYNERYHLIDCGEATQIQLRKFKIKNSRLDAIFISHLHGDHILGLPGLLSTLSLFDRDKPLPIFAPANLKVILDTIFKYSETHISFPLEFHALEDYEPGAVLLDTGKFYVTSFPLRHRAWCRGFLFQEHNPKPRFDFYKAKSLDIPNEYFRLLKLGNDITLEDGTVLRSKDVLLPPRNPASYAYCSDTAYEESIIPYIEKATLLYHEATFLHDLLKNAQDTLHSTALQAGQIAKLADVRQLVIGHYSARYRELEPLLEEARSVFERTELALEGRVFELMDYV